MATTLHVATVRRRRSNTAEQLGLQTCLSEGSERSGDGSPGPHRRRPCARPSPEAAEDPPFSIETCASDDTLGGEGPRSPQRSPSGVVTVTRPQLRARSWSCLAPAKDFMRRCQRRTKRACKHSIRLAFLSHLCFLAGAALYLQLARLDLAWAHYQRNNHVPLDDSADDSSDDPADPLDPPSSRDPSYEAHYERTSARLYVAGALCFTAVGLLDWLRYADALYVFMVLAGVAGVLSGLSSEDKGRADAWDWLSNHLYLIEGYTLIRGRKTRKKGGDAPWLRAGNACFISGAVFDVLESDCTLLGLAGFWLRYCDVAAQLLWLACALIDLGAEVYWQLD